MDNILSNWFLLTKNNNLFLYHYPLYYFFYIDKFFRKFFFPLILISFLGSFFSSYIDKFLGSYSDKDEIISSDSRVNQDKDLIVEVRRGKEKKIKAIFKGMLGWVFWIASLYIRAWHLQSCAG